MSPIVDTLRGFALGAFALIAYGLYRSIASTENDWRRLAQHLRARPRFHLFSESMNGTLEGLPFTLSRSGSVKAKKNLMTVDLSKWVNPELALRSKLSVGGTPWARTETFECGEHAFDVVAQLEGPERRWRAILDGPSRRTLRRILVEGVSISGAEAKVWLSGDATAAEIKSRIHLIRHAAEALKVEPSTVAQRLAHNVRNDAIPAVRLRCLRLLLSEYRQTKEAQAAIEHALDDTDDEIRVLAAVASANTKSVKILAAIVTNLCVAPALRAAALDGLVAKGERDRLPGFYALALIADDEVLRTAAVRAMTAAGLPGAAQGLERLLNEDASEPVRRAAGDGLAAIGDKHAVAPLQRYASETTDKLSKLVALEAVRKLQARLGDVDVGFLSLSTGDSAVGAVSEVSTGAGAVSAVSDARTKAR